MNLDDKLEAIMQTWANTDYNQGRDPNRKFDNAKAQLKKAFMDAGYIRYLDLQRQLRFEGQSVTNTVTLEEINQAAKRAAGIGETAA